MAIGDVEPVPDCTDLYYVDTGMYDVPGYGSVYLLDAERPALVDTGLGTHHDRVLDALATVGIERDDLAAILLTHVHLDHAGGAGFLAEACPDATVYTHESGVRHLIDPSRLVAGTKQAVGDQWEYYVDPRPVSDDRIRALSDGDSVDLGDRRLSVMHAPGHAPHQVVFFDDLDDAVFTADAAGLWAASAERLFPTTPPPQFDLDGAVADARAIGARDPSVLCYAHFGPRPNEGDPLAEYERILTDWVERVREVRADLGDDEAAIEYLAEHTEMEGAWPLRKARAEARLNARGVLASLD